MNPLPTIRACFHCHHAIIDDDADMVCSSLQVNDSIKGKLMTCHKARSPEGPCGVEAPVSHHEG